MKKSPVFLFLVIFAGGFCPLSQTSSAEPKLQGQPSWSPLGGEVYWEKDRFEAEKQVLSFIAEPRWFQGFPKHVDKEEFETFMEAEKKRGAGGGSVQMTEDGKYPIPVVVPYPKTIEDLPLIDQGASLQLTVQTTEVPSIFLLKLTLAAEKRTVWRELEHRWTNTLPFLFAFFVDGKALKREPQGFFKEGGANYLEPLVEKGKRRSWELRVDFSSIDSILPHPKVKTLHLVACFSERQHDGFAGPDGPDPGRDIPQKEQYKGPQILVRSGVVRLERLDGKWKVE
ncbi:MAG: hypothetical protein ABSE73_02990 [Planctomycetota bacterium]